MGRNLKRGAPISTSFALSVQELRNLDSAAEAFGQSRSVFIRLVLWEAAHTPAMRIWPDWRPMERQSYGDGGIQNQRCSLSFSASETKMFREVAGRSNFNSMQRWAHHQITFYSHMILCKVRRLPYPPHQGTAPYKAKAGKGPVRTYHPVNDPLQNLNLTRMSETAAPIRADIEAPPAIMERWLPTQALAAVAGVEPLVTAPPVISEPELMPDSDDEAHALEITNALKETRVIDAAQLDPEPIEQDIDMAHVVEREPFAFELHLPEYVEGEQAKPLADLEAVAVKRAGTISRVAIAALDGSPEAEAKLIEMREHFASQSDAIDAWPIGANVWNVNFDAEAAKNLGLAAAALNLDKASYVRAVAAMLIKAAE